jgi:predicted porin
MNKKLMALAVAGALAAPVVAFAQASNVQIYGRLNLGLDSYSATGATAGTAFDYKSRTRVFDAGSRLGFTGSEDLGGGLKAIFLMESGVNVDNGSTTGQSGSPNPNAGTLGSRVGHVGLESSSWGRLTFGRSHVWWGNGTIEQTGANYMATGLPQFYGLLGRGMNVGVSRQSNTLQYSAQMGGNALQVSYSPGGESQAAGANTDGRMWALTVQGQWGALGAGYDWVNLRGNSPAAGPQAVSTGHKLRAGWTYQPGGQISLLWVKSVQDNGGFTVISTNNVAVANALALVPDITATSLSQTSWGVNWEHTFGNVQALAAWGKVNNIPGCAIAGRCDNTSATTWLLGARYIFSKRTAIYVNYATIQNGSNYNMDYIGGWMTSASTTLPAGLGGSNIGPGLLPASAGADPRLFGVGIMHNF